MQHNENLKMQMLCKDRKRTCNFLLGDLESKFGVRDNLPSIWKPTQILSSQPKTPFLDFTSNI